VGIKAAAEGRIGVRRERERDSQTSERKYSRYKQTKQKEWLK
jgi:hypothetical protein